MMFSVWIVTKAPIFYLNLQVRQKVAKNHGIIIPRVFLETSMKFVDMFWSLKMMQQILWKAMESWNKSMKS